MLSPFSILLVDDDPAIVEVLNRTAKISFPEAHFIPVSSFAEAASYLEHLDGEGPKLVLLDIDLQTGPDGFAFLSFLRNHPQGRSLPVVMLSANNDPRNVKKSIDGGASAFTQKPFTYTDWKVYTQALRNYWFDTVTSPTLQFGRSVND